MRISAVCYFYIFSEFVYPALAHMFNIQKIAVFSLDGIGVFQLILCSFLKICMIGTYIPFEHSCDNSFFLQVFQSDFFIDGSAADSLVFMVVPQNTFGSLLIKSGEP